MEIFFFCFGGQAALQMHSKLKLGNVSEINLWIAEDENQECARINKWKRLFAGTVPANKNLFAGTIPANKNLFAGTSSGE